MFVKLNSPKTYRSIFRLGYWPRQSQKFDFLYEKHKNDGILRIQRENSNYLQNSNQILRDSILPYFRAIFANSKKMFQILLDLIDFANISFLSSQFS